MKVRTSERIFLVAFNLIIIALLLVFAFSVLDIIPGDSFTTFFNRVKENAMYVTLIIAIIALLIIYAVSLMFIATKKSPPNHTLIKVTENGSIRITLQTITTIAVKTARALAGVKDVRIVTDTAPEGIVLYVRVAVMNDAVIPEITSQLQSTIKENIETVAGLQVKEIPILVDNSIAATN